MKMRRCFWHSRLAQSMPRSHASRSRSRSPSRDPDPVFSRVLDIWDGTLSGGCVWTGARPAARLTAVDMPRFLEVYLSPAGFFVAQDWPGAPPGRLTLLAARRVCFTEPWPDAGPAVLEASPPRLLVPFALAARPLHSRHLHQDQQAATLSELSYLRLWTRGNGTAAEVHLLSARVLGLPAPPPGAALVGAWDVRAWCPAPREVFVGRFPLPGPSRGSSLIRVSLPPGSRVPYPVLQCVVDDFDPLSTLGRPLGRLLACPFVRLTLRAHPGRTLSGDELPHQLPDLLIAPWVFPASP